MLTIGSSSLLFTSLHVSFPPTPTSTPTHTSAHTQTHIGLHSPSPVITALLTHMLSTAAAVTPPVQLVEGELEPVRVLVAKNHPRPCRTPITQSDIIYETQKQKVAIAGLVQEFTILPATLKAIKDRFKSEMAKGLAKQGETLAMVQTHILGRLKGSGTSPFLCMMCCVSSQLLMNVLRNLSLFVHVRLTHREGDIPDAGYRRHLPKSGTRRALTRRWCQYKTEKVRYRPTAQSWRTKADLWYVFSFCHSVHFIHIGSYSPPILPGRANYATWLVFVYSSYRFLNSCMR